jgi:hypothetical protein
MFLRFVENCAQDPFLKKSASIANLFLETEIVNLVFKHYFKIDLGKSSTRMGKLKIIFESSEDSFGWTCRSTTANQIFINSRFSDRLFYLKKSSRKAKNKKFVRRLRREMKNIIFFLSIVLIHEMAHLVLRWNGVLDSPPIFDNEAGDFIESKIFGGNIRPIVRASEWNKRSKISGNLRK